MHRTFLSLLALLAVLAVPACPAQGADLRVVTEQWPPYTHVEDGKMTGVVSEVVLTALDRSGLSYTVEVLPWARAYKLARTEPNVLIYTILKLESRAPLFTWIKLDGLSIEMYLFRPKHRREIELRTLDDAKNFRVGVTRDTSTHHFLLNHGFKEGENLFPVRCEQLNLLKSQPGTRRVDLTTGDRLSTACALAEGGLPPDYCVPQILLFKEDLYMAFSRDTPARIVERVRRGLEAAQRDGTLDSAVEKYNHMFE